MNREIKFRGKREDNGEWVVGSLISLKPEIAEIFYLKNAHKEKGNETACVYVDPKTVGQYTSLKDKNGKEAYEGDIVKDNQGVIYTIFFDEGGFVMESCPKAFGYGSQGGTNPTSPLADKQTASWFLGCCEIIGNIHDNPELLER